MEVDGSLLVEAEAPLGRMVAAAAGAGGAGDGGAGDGGAGAGTLKFDEAACGKAWQILLDTSSSACFPFVLESYGIPR
jgi:hypothetical protein